MTRRRIRAGTSAYEKEFTDMLNEICKANEPWLETCTEAEAGELFNALYETVLRRFEREFGYSPILNQQNV